MKKEVQTLLATLVKCVLWLLVLACPIGTYAQRNFLRDTTAQIKLLESNKASKDQLTAFGFTIISADAVDALNLGRLINLGLSASKRAGNERLYNLALAYKLLKAVNAQNRTETVKKLEAIEANALKAGDDTLAAVVNYTRIRALGQTISSIEATKIIHASIQKLKSLGISQLEVRARVHYAFFYGYGGTYDRTRDLYNQAASFARSLNDTVCLIQALNNKANIFNNAKQYDSSLVTIQAAERLAKIGSAVRLLFMLRLTRAEAYFGMGKYKECLALSDTLESQENAVVKIMDVGLWKLRGISLGKVGRYADQERYCWKTLEAIRSQGLLLEQDDIWMALAKAQLMQGKHEEALRSLDSSKVIGGKYYNITISKQMTEAETKLNSAEQRFQIQKLEDEKRTQSKINYLLTAILLLAVTLLIVGMLLSLKLYRGRKALQQQNEIIEAQNQQLSSLNSSKDKIMGIIAHDLRSPLSTLSSLSLVGKDLISNGNREELNELFNHITTSAANLNTLVTNLFNWAVSLDGNLAVKLEALPVLDIANKVVELYADKAKSKNIQLVVKVNADNTAYADYNSLLTITRNLVNNALKFTPNGGNIIIAAHDEEHHSVLSVQDNGKGMTEAQLQGLLRTERAKHTRGTDGETGTGLGMLIVKELVAINNGSMAVSSGPGLGTTIRVKLPKSEQAIPAEKQTPEAVISVIPLAYPVVTQQ